MPSATLARTSGLPLILAWTKILVLVAWESHHPLGWKSCANQFNEKSACRFFTLLKLKGWRGNERFRKPIFGTIKKKSDLWKSVQNKDKMFISNILQVVVFKEIVLDEFLGWVWLFHVSFESVCFLL